MRLVWIWSTVFFGSHVCRDLWPGSGAPLTAFDVEELKYQINSARLLIEGRNRITEDHVSRVFWQGLLLRASLVIDLILVVWVLVLKYRSPVPSDISRPVLGDTGGSSSSESETDVPCSVPSKSASSDLSALPPVPKRPSDFGKGKANRR